MAAATSPSPRFFLSCPLCMGLKRRSMFCWDPNEGLGKGGRISITRRSRGGLREFRCFHLVQLSDHRKGEGLPDAMLIALSTLCQLLNTKAMAER